jgi:hypothetical protein
MRKYAAFISYSQHDVKWAAWLHHALETFRIPKELVGKSTQTGEIPLRLFPVFRDRQELAASADLGDALDKALCQSSFLVVVCSRASTHSRWVNEEILRFKHLGRANRILAMIVDGDPDGGLDETPFPEALTHVVDETGSLTKTLVVPIAADARPGRDERGDVLLKLVAGLIGVPLDELKRRDQRRRVRRMRIALSVVTCLMLLFAGLTAVALWQWHQAVERRTQAEEALKRSEQFALTILFHLDTSFDPGNGRDSAARVNIENAIREYDSSVAVSSQFKSEIDDFRYRSHIKRSEMLSAINSPEAALNELREVRNELEKAVSQKNTSADSRALLIEVYQRISILLDDRGDNLGAQTQRARALKVASQCPRCAPEIVERLREAYIRSPLGPIPQ